MTPPTSNNRKLNAFFDRIAEEWEHDLKLIQEEMEQERDVRTYLRNKRSIVSRKYIRLIWKDYMT